MKYILILFGLLIFFNCNSKSQDSLSYAVKTIESNDIVEYSGKKLMEANCYVCHSPTASHDSRLAPPMEAIKRHYINEDTSKEEFTKAMQDWIKNPNKDDAKMYGAVKRFGVMPKQYFSEKTIEEISSYMFDNDIEKPEWFNRHHEKKIKGGM